MGQRFVQRFNDSIQGGSCSSYLQGLDILSLAGSCIENTPDLALQTSSVFSFLQAFPPVHDGGAVISLQNGN